MNLAARFSGSASGSFDLVPFRGLFAFGVSSSSSLPSKRFKSRDDETEAEVDACEDFVPYGA